MIDTASPPFLSIRDLHASYGPIRALQGISLDVGRGEIVALIGANGAGKTALMRSLSGLIASTGSAMLDPGDSPAIDLLKQDAHKIPGLGVAHVPEGRGIFLNLSVFENLKMGAYLRRDKDEIKHDLERRFDQFPRLKERRNQAALTLSGGEQQMLAIARALMGRPRLLLLDEPSLGLAPKLVKEIFEAIAGLNAEGMTILLVEQNANLALRYSRRGYVLETGRIVLHAPSAELAGDPGVRKAYLGEAGGR